MSKSKTPYCEACGAPRINMEGGFVGHLEADHTLYLCATHFGEPEVRRVIVGENFQGLIASRREEFSARSKAEAARLERAEGQRAHFSMPAATVLTR